MSYTNRYGQPQGVAKLYTNKLREILIAEIIAINGYARHIANSNMKEVNSVWQHIMEDEMKHYGMILKLLRKYDPAEYQGYKNHISDISGLKEPMQAFTPSYNKQLILNNIREDIKGELEAVILYEPQLASIPYSDVRNALQYIINDEKEHSEHLTLLMLKYEPGDYFGLK